MDFIIRAFDELTTEAKTQQLEQKDRVDVKQKNIRVELYSYVSYVTCQKAREVPRKGF